MSFIEPCTGSFFMLKKWQMPNIKPKKHTTKPNIKMDLPFTAFPKKLTKDKSGTTKFASLANAWLIHAVSTANSAAIFLNDNTLLNIQIPYSILLQTYVFYFLFLLLSFFLFL